MNGRTTDAIEFAVTQKIEKWNRTAVIRRGVVPLLLLSLFFTPLRSEPICSVPPFAAGKLGEITIDGKGDDWNGAGLHVAQLCDPEGRTADLADLSASFNLGWNERGFYFLIHVYDNDCYETDGEGALYQRDSVEIFFSENYFTGAADPGWKNRNTLQPIFGAGFSAERPQLRYYIYDQRNEEGKKNPKTIEAAKTLQPGGYLMEVCIPWEIFGTKTPAQTVYGVQVQVNDIDRKQDTMKNGITNGTAGGVEDGRGRAQILWNPVPGKGMPVVLAEKKGNDVLVAGQITYEKMKNALLRVWGNADGVSGNGESATTILPLPTVTNPAPCLIQDKNGTSFPVEYPDFEKEKKRILNSKWIPSELIFSGKKFPEGKFENGESFLSLIEPGSLSVRYFDRNYKQVKKPGEYGRYGVEISFSVPGKEKEYRYTTLCRVPQTPAFSNGVPPPSFFGLPQECAAEAPLFWNALNDPKKLPGRNYKTTGAEIFAAFYDTLLSSSSVEKERKENLSASQKRSGKYSNLLPWCTDSNWWYHFEQRYNRLSNLMFVREPVRIDTPGERASRDKYPLVVFLHGTGGGNEKSVMAEPIRKWFESHPEIRAYLCQPVSRNDGWAPDEVLYFIEEMIQKYSVDENKIVLTGFSMGAIGTWHFAMSYPQKCRRYLPAAGYSEAQVVGNLALSGREVQAWHGDKDGIPYVLQKELIEKLNEAGGKGTFVLLKGEDHTTTPEAVYLKEETYKWLLPD